MSNGEVGSNSADQSAGPPTEAAVTAPRPRPSIPTVVRENRSGLGKKRGLSRRRNSNQAESSSANGATNPSGQYKRRGLNRRRASGGQNNNGTNISRQRGTFPLEKFSRRARTDTREQEQEAETCVPAFQDEDSDDNNSRNSLLSNHSNDDNRSYRGSANASDTGSQTPLLEAILVSQEEETSANAENPSPPMDLVIAEPAPENFKCFPTTSRGALFCFGIVFLVVVLLVSVTAIIFTSSIFEAPNANNSEPLPTNSSGDNSAAPTSFRGSTLGPTGQASTPGPTGSTPAPSSSAPTTSLPSTSISTPGPTGVMFTPGPTGVIFTPGPTGITPSPSSNTPGPTEQTPTRSTPAPSPFATLGPTGSIPPDAAIPTSAPSLRNIFVRPTPTRQQNTSFDNQTGSTTVAPNVTTTETPAGQQDIPSTWPSISNLPSSAPTTSSSPSFVPSLSMSPSNHPSTKADVLDALGPTPMDISFLPTRTIVALQDPTTPQGKAYDWYTSNFLDTISSNWPLWRKQQVFAMASIYYSLGGDSWDASDRQDWLDPLAHECEWAPQRQSSGLVESMQIECSESLAITELQFWNFENALSGAMAPEIGLLSSLETLLFLGTTWTGTLEDSLPTELRAMPSLSTLYLQWKALSGTIPTQFGLLSSLTRLSIFDNESITGTIPSELGLLKSLEGFFAMDTSLTGTIPNELGDLTALNYLRLIGTDIEGRMPKSLCLRQPSMEQLNLDCDKVDCSCRFSTSSPTMGPTASYVTFLPTPTITALQNPTLPQGKAYQWYRNNLLATAVDWPEWRKQQVFTMVCIFYSLGGESWDASDRQNWLNPDVFECNWAPQPQLTPAGDESIQIKCSATNHLTSLKFYYFDKPLIGALPPEIELLSSLETLQFLNSGWTGNLEDVLPVEIANMPSLTELYLGWNNLSGSIPSEFGLMTSLTSLSLFMNSNIIGTIPTELGLMVSLERLSAYDTELSGTVPAPLCGIQLNLDCEDNIDCDC